MPVIVEARPGLAFTCCGWSGLNCLVCWFTCASVYIVMGIILVYTFRLLEPEEEIVAAPTPEDDLYLDLEGYGGYG